ncbi:hypothetical protein [Nevskia sp.]|uniref:hypothetical protein n=1 Tax=Nevskia sp. TaxID=1929292 RepID=UPI003F72049D
MRRHLELEGTATASVLAEVAQIPSGRVSALLKGDLESGRVEFIEGYDGEKRTYRWNERPLLTQALRRAIKRLEEMGYVVIAP